MRYQLCKEQQLNCDIETAWRFFSSPANLSKITPKDMNFSVCSTLEGDIYEGMKIDYTVAPLWGITMKWRTKITQVDYQRSFTDFQEKGPYRYWNHHHKFIVNDKGVLMIDVVDYELSLGFLNPIIHKILVRHKLETIFDFRFNVLEQMFNQKS